MIFISNNIFWTIYAPIIIAVISVYINNSSAMFSMRMNRVHKSLNELHELKAVNIYKALQTIITNKNKHQFDYGSVQGLQQTLFREYYRLYDALDSLRLYIYPIRMNRCQSNQTWYLLRNIIICIRQEHVFTYTIWGSICNNLRHSKKKQQNNPFYISKLIEYEFNHASPISTCEIMSSLKTLDNNLTSLKDILKPMGHTLLIIYELKRAFLGKSLGKRHKVDYF